MENLWWKMFKGKVGGRRGGRLLYLQVVNGMRISKESTFSFVETFFLWENKRKRRKGKEKHKGTRKKAIENGVLSFNYWTGWCLWFCDLVNCAVYRKTNHWDCKIRNFFEHGRGKKKDFWMRWLILWVDASIHRDTQSIDNDKRKGRHGCLGYLRPQNGMRKAQVIWDYSCATLN